MNATIAAQMTGADLLKLRKKRGTMIWVLVLALAPIVILFTVKAIQHASNPAEERAGRRHSGLHRRPAPARAVLRSAGGDPDRRRGRRPGMPPRACSATSS